ncbi:MAG: hypothetical protein JW827_11775 [Spirochaetes bacterium]|nr:hypothetical protein [Spirochaetota bacterium]
MNKVKRQELKKRILENFVRFIESKPELVRDEMLRDAFSKLKSSLK